MSDTRAVSGGVVVRDEFLVSADQETVVGDGSAERPLHAPGGAGGAGAKVTLINGNAGALLPGAPVQSSASGIVDKTRANALASSIFLGLATALAASGAPVIVQLDGVATFTTTQWDAITGGSGGLTPRAQYYLSDAVAGRLLISPGPAASSGSYSTLVGQAISATQMNLTPADPIGPL